MKRIFIILIVITTFSAASNTINAQVIDDSEALAFVDFKELEKHHTKYDSKSNLDKSEADLAAQAKAYDLYVSEDFGSYLNPYNGTLNIINNNSKQFTKAQFLNKSSNENVFSIKIDAEVKSINISKYKSGDYILILSNEKGDILAEDYIII